MLGMPGIPGMPGLACMPGMERFGLIKVIDFKLCQIITEVVTHLVQSYFKVVANVLDTY